MLSKVLVLSRARCTIRPTTINYNVIIVKSSLNEGPYSEHTMEMQGLSVPFACVGSGDPVRVLCLYTTNTLDTL